VKDGPFTSTLVEPSLVGSSIEPLISVPGC